MIVTCKHCATRFNLDDRRVKPSGVKVRCSNCQQVYRVYPPASEPEDATSTSPTGTAGHAAAASLTAAGMASGARSVTEKPQWMGGGRSAASQAGEISGEDDIDLDATEFSDFEKMLAAPPEPEERPREEVPGTDWDEPLMLDLSDLEIETEAGESGDADFGFDLLSDEEPPAAEPPPMDPVPLIDRDLEDLDPTEIEALLELDGPLEPPAPGDGDGQMRKMVFDSAAGSESSLPEEKVGDLEEGVGAEKAAGRPTGRMEWDVEVPPAFSSDFESDQALTGGSDEDLDLTLLEKMISEADDSVKGMLPKPDAPVSPGSAYPAKDDERDALSGDEGVLAGDDIDLASLDALLDEEIAAEATLGESTAGGGKPDEPDLALDLDSAPADAGVEAPEADEGLVEDTFDFSDLELALQEEPADLGEDAGSEAGPVTFEHVEEDFSGIDSTDALDFSDIEKLLEEEIGAVEAPEEEAAEDLELELDLDFDDGAEGAGIDSGVEIDAVEETEAPKTPGREEAPVPEAASQPEELDLELENIPEEFAGASVILDGEDGLELETLANYEDLETVAAEAIDRLNNKHPEKAEVPVHTFEMGTTDDDDLLAMELGAATGASAPRSAGRKGVRAPLLILLILALIGGGGYAAYTMLDGANIRIPFVDRFLKQQPPDAGDLYNIQPMDVQSRFVSNSTTGTLLIVSGRAKNAYDHPRSYIQIKGTLRAQDGRSLKTLTVYCGNTIAEKELETLDMAALGKRMSRRGGASRSNVKVPSGRSVPFMLVFSDLPADLGEFAVEPAGSVSAR